MAGLLGGLPFGGAAAPAMPYGAGTVAPMGGMHGHMGGPIDAYGKPVYRKKWLLGKWKYAGLRDVRYVPRPVAPIAHGHVDMCPPAHIDMHCAPAAAHCDTASFCAPTAAHCAPTAAHCAPAACGPTFPGMCA